MHKLKNPWVEAVRPRRRRKKHGLKSPNSSLLFERRKQWRNHGKTSAEFTVFLQLPRLTGNSGTVAPYLAPKPRNIPQAKAQLAPGQRREEFSLLPSHVSPAPARAKSSDWPTQVSTAYHQPQRLFTAAVTGDRS